MSKRYVEAAIEDAMIDMDKRIAKRESHVNIYRLGILLKAAQDVADAVSDGIEPIKAFAQCFTPNRDTNRIAKSFGWDIDFDEWNRA